MIKNFAINGGGNSASDVNDDGKINIMVKRELYLSKINRMLDICHRFLFQFNKGYK